MDIGYVQRVYKDVVGLWEMNSNTLHADAILERFAPDADAIIEEVLADQEWTQQIAATAQIQSRDEMESALGWMLVWTYQLFGAQTVRQFLASHRKPFITAAVNVCMDPGLFDPTSTRTPMSQWLGDFLALFVAARIVAMENELDTTLEEPIMFGMLDGVIIQEIKHRGIRAAVRRYATQALRDILDGRDADHGAPEGTTHH
jgi:hypothetical protein